MEGSGDVDSDPANAKHDRKRGPQIMEGINEDEPFKRLKNATSENEDHSSKVHASKIVRLNVGGSRIDVLRSTLTSVEGSLLETMFSGRWDDSLDRDQDGNLFIDQPINLFLPMLNYLRAKAIVTPRAPVVQSPAVASSEKKRFMGMLEYYGMANALYPFGIFKAGCLRDGLVSTYPEYSVDAEEWTSFVLLPVDSNTECTSVKSFEITLGKCTGVQVGWATMSEIPFEGPETSCHKEARGRNGVGYYLPSVGIDCDRKRIARSFENAVSYYKAETTEFSAIDDFPSVGEGTTIRCEDRGAHRCWFIDGRKISESRSIEWRCSDADTHLQKNGVPCFSVKGSLRISDIHVEF